MPAFTAVLQQAMNKVGYEGLGIYLPNTTVFTALSTTTATAPQVFMNGLYSSNSFLGAAFWRPGANSAADYVRHIASIVPTTGVATFDVNVTDGTIGSEDAYVLPPGIEPYMVIGAATTMLRNYFFPNLEPLSWKPVGTAIADAGFQNTATSAFTASGTTFTKVSTANSENVFRGIGSGRTLNAGYIYQQFAINSGELVIIHALSRLASGTNASLVVRDATNSADIGTAVTHDNRKWSWMRRVESQTSTGKLMDVRLTAVGATDDVYWNALTVMPANARRMILDTRWDTQYKTELGLKYVEFRGPTTDSGVYDAFATELVDVPPHLYDFYIETPGANPVEIQFHDGIENYLDKPLYIQGRRALSDLYSITMADVATSIPGNLDLMVALFLEAFYSRGDVRRVVADWPLELARAEAEVGKYTRRNEVTGPARQLQMSRWGTGI